MNTALGVSAALLAEVEQLMMRLVESSSPRCAQMAREHLQTGGKRLRAALAVAAVRAFGADASLGVPWAAACELMHNATLVHDDVQDGDALRRGHPTIWVRYGMPNAINLGDFMLMQAFVALGELRLNGDSRFMLTQLLAQRISKVVMGQVAEIELSRLRPITWRAYAEAVEGKTSALFELPVEGAAIVAGLGNAQRQELSTAVRPLGLLFQLQDDVLDLFGNKGREAPGSDLKEGKISSLVVAHLDLFPSKADALLTQLTKARGETTDAWVQQTIERFSHDGTLEAVRQRILTLRQAILRHNLWQTYPQLGEVVAALVQRIIEPIDHIVRA